MPGDAKLTLVFAARDLASGAVKSLNSELGRFGLAAGAGAAITTKAMGILDSAISGVVSGMGDMVKGAMADEESQNRELIGQAARIGYVTAKIEPSIQEATRWGSDDKPYLSSVAVARAVGALIGIDLIEDAPGHCERACSMTAPSWAERDQKGRDAAWTAWRRVGVEPFVVAFIDSPTPHPLLGIAEAFAKAMGDVTLAVIDELGESLDREATERIMVEAVSDSVRHVPWSIVEAIGHELARTDPVPFSPPPAGSWVRSRWLTRPGRRETPEWNGMWHVYSGDFKTGDVRSQDVTGRARCGAHLQLRNIGLSSGVPLWDYVVADDRPGVDACRRCQRSTREAVTA